MQGGGNPAFSLRCCFFRQQATNWGDVSSITSQHRGFTKMNGIIYLIGLVVVVLAILSFFGMR